MACAAIRQATVRIDVILRDQVPSFGLLILRRVPSHVVNFGARSHEILWLPVAFETPFHVERVHAPGQRHLIHCTMTGGTADTFGDMNAVVEIGEVWQIMNAIPL